MLIQALAPPPFGSRQRGHLTEQRGRDSISNVKAAEREVFDATALGNSPVPPWLLGFQCNERYLKWDSSAQIQLLKIHAAKEMGKVRITFSGRQVLMSSLGDSVAMSAAVVCSRGLGFITPCNILHSA